jgi:general secretion pathway protein D
MLVHFAEGCRMNFILGDVKEIQGKKVSIITHKEVPGRAAWEAFLSAMQVTGFALTEAGPNAYRVVKASDAIKTPLGVRTGVPGARSDEFITQLIQLDNVSVTEVSKVVATMVPAEAEVTAYAPTNTLIITDTANNLRKVYRILQELDVAAPKSSFKMYQINFADAQEIKTIIEELFGTEETADTSSKSRSSRSSSRSSSSSRRPSSRTSRAKTETEALTAGEKAKYISKVLQDERTNSLIVLANADGHKEITELIAKLDVDIEPGGEIHVVYLEHAKAEEVAQVLQELSQEAG